MAIEVKEIIRSKRRTLALIVQPDGSLIVRAPLKAPHRSIREFVQNNVKWIEKKQAQARALVLPTPKKYVDGEEFLFLGDSYPLQIVRNQKQALVFDGCYKLAESAQSRGATEFERWYRARAKQILTDRVNCFAQQYGFKYAGLRINAARTRWGSCSPTGALNFSWRLIMAPMESIDYVVVHELVHTIIHNHSRRFWNKVESIMPDYKSRKVWLKEHGQELLL